MQQENIPHSATWHALEASKALALLQVDPGRGLSEQEAKLRQVQFGLNRLPAAGKKSLVLKFLKQFHDILIYILLVAGIIAASMGHYVDATVIVLVTVINAAIGFVQEYKAENALAEIRNILALKALVVREGKRREVDAAQLAFGDCVYLNAGDKVPADMRLLRAATLRIDESTLTGEAVPVEKQTEAVREDTMLGDRTNMAFSGTPVVSGSGLGVVVAVGAATEIGKINTMIAEVKPLTTPLLRQTARFGKTIAAFILAASAVIFVLGHFWHNHEPASLLLSVIAMAIAAIPEGLPAIISIILALGVQSMARRKAIVRSLPSVETLGSVSVICTDKTGTLTKSEMTVAALTTLGRRYEVTGSGYAPEGNILSAGVSVKAGNEESLRRLLTCFKLCNDSSVAQEPNGQWIAVGDPTESALAALWMKSGLSDYDPPQLSAIPFDSEHKYMAILCKGEPGNAVYVKGAPERLLEMVYGPGSDAQDRREEKQYWLEQIDALSRKGMRLIAGTWKEVDGKREKLEHDDLRRGLTFLGLAGILDPPREEAAAAVALCRQAGIRVKMITGDHAETARFIGGQTGIEDGAPVLEGRDIDALTDNELLEPACLCHIFARTNPEHKLRLVRALQARGLICAMTGDGVNDAPALRMADIGVAMGIKGSEVTKEAAAVVLADDNFKTIAAAVEEGRKVYDNLRKTLLFILPTNIAESLIIAAGILLGNVMMLTPVQVLWVNMVTAVTISLALAFEPLEPDAMKKPPRKPDAPLLSGYFVFRIIYVALLIGGGCLVFGFVLLDVAAMPEQVFRTIILQTLVLCECSYLLSCRGILKPAFGKDFFANKAVFIVLGILAVVQLAITYIPFLNLAMGTAPLAAAQWALPLSAAGLLLLVVEAEKLVARAWVRTRPAKTQDTNAC